MPIKRASFKDLRKSKKRHYKNISTKSELHSLVKKFEGLVSGKKSDEAKTVLKALISKIDKAASKGIVHKNAASRKISRLTKRLALAGKA
jgi:small subunit ribosomal protein S20